MGLFSLMFLGSDESLEHMVLFSGTDILTPKSRCYIVHLQESMKTKHPGTFIEK